MMPNHDILISICVPTFNRLFLLERNVNFHLEHFRRLGVSFEIVVVDDCSTDGTDAFLVSHAATPELRAYKRVKNSGFLSNYAFAMRRARGRYAVFLGDDDLLIPEKVIEYVNLMEADASIGVVQAPWLLVDGRAGGGDIGPFYKIPAPVRIRKSAYVDLVEFILNDHIFPEFMIIRRDVLAQSISGTAPFIFWAFLFTGRALDKADILFMPEPFARVTAVSDDPRQQQGNNECMFQWDTYRGGLEYLASNAWRVMPGPSELRESFYGRLMRFMLIRQSVALKLHVQMKNWAEAYILYHRMAAYHDEPLSPATMETVRKLAGVTVAANEAINYADGAVVVDPMLGDDIINLLPDAMREKLTRTLPSADDPRPTAWLRLDIHFGEPVKDRDGIFDVREYIAQFI